LYRNVFGYHWVHVCHWNSVGNQLSSSIKSDVLSGNQRNLFHGVDPSVNQWGSSGNQCMEFLWHQLELTTGTPWIPQTFHYLQLPPHSNSLVANETPLVAIAVSLVMIIMELTVNQWELWCKKWRSCGTGQNLCHWKSIGGHWNPWLPMEFQWQNYIWSSQRTVGSSGNQWNSCHWNSLVLTLIQAPVGRTTVYITNTSK
jgi:hypothetical protein